MTQQINGNSTLSAVGFYNYCVSLYWNLDSTMKLKTMTAFKGLNAGIPFYSSFWKFLRNLDTPLLGHKFLTTL